MSYTGTQSTLRTDTTTVNNLTLCNTNTPININLDGNSLIDERINSLLQQMEEMKNMFVYCCTGTIHPYAGPAYDSVSFEILPPPPNYDWCFGQIVSKNDERYSALYSAIGDYWNTTTELTEDQFQLPDLRNVFLRGCPEYIESSEENRLVGNFQACGVPNSKGVLMYSNASTEGSGPFYHMSEKQKYAGHTEYNSEWKAGFDLSRSSSVYQDGLTEVRPNNKAVNYIIKL